MRKKLVHLKGGLALLAVTASLCLVQPATAQTAPAQDTKKPVPSRGTSSGDPDRDTNYGMLTSFDSFLDGHREIAEQIRKNPSLLNNEDFVKAHPALQTYLRDHPEVTQEIQENPNEFMRAENRIDHPNGKPGDINYGELTSFDRFLDGHRETAEQIRKDPSLLDNREFLKNHPALQSYLQDHPEVRNEIRDNPNAFMHAENRIDHPEDARNRDVSGDRDTTHRQLASFDRFLDNHRETAEQLRKNPSLVDNPEFMKNHPELQTYLQDHPGVREEVKENPNAFMQAENRYDQREAGFDHDRMGMRDHTGTGDVDRDSTHRHFGEFLGGHSDIAHLLSKDPSQVKDQAFLESHPDLKEFLNTHPDVRHDLMANPDTFVKSSQQFANTNNSGSSTGTTQPVKSPTTAKPKTNP